MMETNQGVPVAESDAVAARGELPCPAGQGHCPGKGCCCAPGHGGVPDGGPDTEHPIGPLLPCNQADCLDRRVPKEGVEPTREEVKQQIAEHLLAIGMLGSIHRIPEIGQCVGRLGLLFAELESMP